MIYGIWARDSTLAEADPDPVAACFDLRAGRRQFVLTWDDDFYFATMLPGTFRLLDIGQLLETLSPVRAYILGALVNVDGDEWSLVWPKRCELTSHESVIDVFMSVDADSNLSYGEQEAKYICDPLIWFEDWTERTAS